jgi:hypothetical protein
MAVIRQQRQTFTQPIGVVRADTSQQLSQQITRSAQRLSQLAYNEAAKRAEKAGREAALSVESSKIVSIDPTTNKPEAYRPPQGFGGIASEAYQDMIDRRFEDSVQQELERRGAELSVSAPNADAYLEAMNNYIGSMYNASGEQTMFSRYIKEAGEKYSTSTYATLKKKEIAAQRDALIRQQKVGLFNAKRNISAMIAAGVDAESIETAIAGERLRLNSLFESKGITVSQYGSETEDLDGFMSTISSGELLKKYGEMSDSMQNQLILAIQNPNVLDAMDEDVQRLVTTAKVAASPTELISALNAYGKAQSDYQESTVDAVVSSQVPNITADSTIAEINGLVADQEDDVRKEAIADLTSTWLELNLDKVVDEGDDSAIMIDKIASELLSSGPINYTAIKSMFGPEKGKEIVSQIKALSTGDRESLAKNIQDRRAQLGRIQSQENKDLEMSFRNRGFALEQSSNAPVDFELLTSDILQSDLENKSSILEAVSNKFASYAVDDVRSMNLSLDQMKNVQAAVVDKSLFQRLESGAEVKAYELFRAAYKVNPTSTAGYMTRMINSKKATAEADTNALRMDYYKDAVSKGVNVSGPELEDYDEQMLGGAVVTMATVGDFPHIVEGLNAGIVMPSFVSAMESAVASNNTDQMAAAIEYFDRYTNREIVVDNRIIQQDDLRGKIPSETYALLSAVSTTAAMEGVEPLAIMAEFKSYDGNADTEIMADLEQPNVSFDRVLDGQEAMSPVYKREIRNVLRIRKVRGETITDDVIKEVISSYTKNMKVDEKVVAPRIGDATVYARNNFGITKTDMVSLENNLAEALADALESELVANDTPAGQSANSILGGIRSLLMTDLVLKSEATWEAFTGGYDAITELNRRDRLRNGLAALNVDLMYRPVFQAFNEGRPTWEVGYMTTTGAFERITVNGEPFTLEAASEDVMSSRIRRERDAAFTRLKGNNAPDKIVAEAELKWLSSTAHMDMGTFLSDVNQVSRFAERMGVSPQKVQDLFAQYRYEYMVGSVGEITGAK